MIRSTLIFLFLLFFFLNGSSCKEVHKRPFSSGINVVIQDMACDEVKGRLIHEAKEQHFPFEWLDKEQGLLSIGPLITSPLPGNSFEKAEEKFRLEIKCIDPISTRISVQILLKGLTSDHQWKEIKDPEMLNAYGNRFLDRLIKP